MGVRLKYEAKGMNKINRECSSPVPLELVATIGFLGRNRGQ